MDELFSTLENYSNMTMQYLVVSVDRPPCQNPAYCSIPRPALLATRAPCVLA